MTQQEDPATAAGQIWTITAANGEGDTVELREHPHSQLDHLLKQGVHALVGAHAKPEDYELLIRGRVQTNLTVSLEAAGLHDGSEVTILPKDVSRG